MHKQTRFFLSAAFVMLTAAASSGAVMAPDWVKHAANESLPTYPPDTNAVVLLDATEDVITAPGEYDEHYRRVVKILRHEGRGEGTFFVGLNKQEKLVSVHGWSIDKAGIEYELKDKEFLDRSPYDESLYSDYHARIGQVPASNAGSIVGFEYFVHRHGWLNQVEWSYQEDIPIREAQFKLQLPAGWEYKTSWSSGSTPTAEQIPGGSQWILRDVPAIEEEERSPPFRALAGHAGFAYFSAGQPPVGSWDGIGRWYGDLTSGRRTASPEIAQKARELTLGKTTFDAKLRALAGFLQTDIRYVAIEIGIGGYQPHAASDVFRARYGDCKDKATLLSSLLKEVGIDSNYVVISTYRGTVNPKVPSARGFNHVILAIPLVADAGSVDYASVITSKAGQRYLIFDPTDQYTPIGDLRAALQDTDALLVLETGGELIHTPLFQPGRNVFTREGHFTLSSEGTLAGEVIETRNGDSAHRSRLELAQANQQERSQHLEQELNESLKGFTVEKLDVQQLDQLQKDLVIKLELSVPQYGQVRGPLMLIRPRVLGQKSFDLDHKKPRQYPVTLHAASQETDIYEIELPKDFTVDEIPDPLKIDMGFASYQSKVEVSGSKLRYWREYTVHDLSVKPEKFADLRKFEGTIGADENTVVVLKKNQ